MTRSRPSSAATPGRRECGTWPGRSRCAPRRRRAAGHGLEEHENEEPRRGRREKRDEEGQGEHDEQEGNEAPFEVTPETVVEMLGAPAACRCAFDLEWQKLLQVRAFQRKHQRARQRLKDRHQEKREVRR